MNQARPWWQVRDPEMAALTDAELAEYMKAWGANLRRYREQAQDPTIPRERGMRGPGYSVWWAGKILDRGIRERDRRRHRLRTRLATDLARLAQAKDHTDEPAKEQPDADDR